MSRDTTPRTSSISPMPASSASPSAAPEGQRPATAVTDRTGWAGASISLPTSGSTARRSADDRRVRDSALETEVRRLQGVCERRELTIDCLVKATLALRQGGLALRDENRELRRQLERLRRKPA